MNDRLVLGLDTSFGPVAAALVAQTGEIVACIEADNPAGAQAETLPPLVAKLGIDFKRLARVAVTVGPGAFTGVRVGLAFAKGLRLATGADVLGFTTLECLAAQAAGEAAGHSVGVAIDAKRGEVYMQAFSPSLAPLCDAALLPVGEAVQLLRRTLAAPFVLTGSGARLVDAEARVVAAARIDVKLLAQRAIGADPQRHPPTPAYLRAPDAKLPA